MKHGTSIILIGLLGAGGAASAQDEERVAPLLAERWTGRVEVVQPRAVSKHGALELVALFGVIPNDAFLLYLPLGARVAWHLSERWALEAAGEFNLAVDSGLRRYLVENDAALRVRLRERQQLRFNLGGQWAPVYGKLALGGAVIHLDSYLAAGAGLLRTAAEASVALLAAVLPDFYLGAGLRVFLGRRWLLRLEYRQYLFPRPTDREGRGGGPGAASEVGLCGGVLLGGRR